MDKDQKTILVIRSSAMGDVAMTVPVLRAVRMAYPGVRIVMLTPKLYEPFFDGLSLTFHNIDLSSVHRGIRGIWRLYNELKLKYKFDAVIDLHDKLYSKLLLRFFRIDGVRTYHIDKRRSEKKALTRKRNKVRKQLRTTIMCYADAMAAAGYPVTPDNRLVRQERPIPAFAGGRNGPWIGIAPFAKHAGKVLPLETVKELITIIGRNMPKARLFIFGGGPAEKEIARTIEAEYPNVVSAIGKTGIAGELDLMANLDVMVSMDSSAMHMSSIVGTPVVSVWGATHYHAGFMGYGQSYGNAVGSDLPCRPCSVYGNRPCRRDDYACLREITAAQIFSSMVSVLEQ